jgi:ribosome-binding factor A
MSRSGSTRREKRDVRISDSIIDEGAGHRHARLQELVQRELVALLRDEVADPRLEQVRIASVVLSVDYRHARVHFTVVRRNDTDHADGGGVGRALERATPFLRGRLAETVDLKRVPELRFVFDGEVVP